ncbi:Thiol peroxidase, Tpx-type [Clostridiaceae bacterium JG1575]|nr:Thiol peroxidase, Tpx-type [Clostridiaceae bacterium JG1575]
MNITFGGKPIHLKGTPLTKGAQLPAFTLTGMDLAPFSSDQIQMPAVILAFPSVDTSVCSLELLTFNDRLEGTGFNVYGVSCDLPFAMDRWVKANAGEYITMLSDYKDRSFGEATGTLIDDLKILARAAFIFDAKGQCQYAEFVPEVGNEPDYDAILDKATEIFQG